MSIVITISSSEMLLLRQSPPLGTIAPNRNYHGINRTSCYRMEQGKNITLASLIKIAECHNLTPAELLDWAEKMKKK